MSSENTKIWQFNQYQKPDNTPSNIDADLESLIRKVDRCKNDPEKSSIKKKVEHSMSMIWTFPGKERKHGSLKKFFKSLKEHAVLHIVYVI